MALEGHKYLFVLGGVMSGVGKGIASSSIGLILKERGYEVNLVKIDPYLNVDAGTRPSTARCSCCPLVLKLTRTWATTSDS